MGLRDVVGRGPLGFSGMGFTFPLGSGSLRALCRQAWQAPQEDDRVGLAAALAIGGALVPTAGDRGRSRSRLRIAQTAQPMPQALQSDHLHHPLALGCRTLRTCSATAARQIGRPRLKGERLPNLSEVAQAPNTVCKPT